MEDFSRCCLTTALGRVYEYTVADGVDYVHAAETDKLLYRFKLMIRMKKTEDKSRTRTDRLTLSLGGC